MASASKISTFTAIGAMALAGFSLPGCEERAPAGPSVGSAADRLSTVDRESSKTSRLGEVHDVGNGIFVFPATRTFPETLSDFREANPNLRIVSVTNGVDVRYFVQGVNSAYSQSASFIVVTEPASLR
jgi:hypothetical protein